MSIISQETFEKFTEEEKQNVRSHYEAFDEPMLIRSYADLFGKENLQPKPKIRTWEDINKMDNRYHQLIDEIIRSGYSSLWDSKVINKVIATLKISKLIEIGYGGLVTEEEWERDSIKKWSIVYLSFEKEYKIMAQSHRKEFITFRTQQQAEEFMSYPENVKLVEQYHMI